MTFDENWKAEIKRAQSDAQMLSFYLSEAFFRPRIEDAETDLVKAEEAIEKAKAAIDRARAFRGRE